MPSAVRPTILVTGGAGYVGAHTCSALAAAGFSPVVYDNLSNGHAEAVQWGPLEQSDVRDSARLDALFALHGPAQRAGACVCVHPPRGRWLCGRFGPAQRLGADDRLCDALQTASRLDPKPANQISAPVLIMVADDLDFR